MVRAGGMADADGRTGAAAVGRRVQARDEVHNQVHESIAAGARLVWGGEVPDRPGA